MKKMEKENIKTKKQKNSVLGGCEEKRLFVEMAFLEKSANTICVPKVPFFCAHTKSPNTIQ